jgi:hypothetical protein
MFCAVVIPGTDLTQVVAVGAATMVNVCGAEVPPVGPGLITVTAALPTEAISVVGMVAIIWLALTHEDESGAPFQLTFAPFSKFEPYRAKLTPEDPTTALEGEMADNVGVSCSGGGWLLPLLPPPPPQAASRKVARMTILADAGLMRSRRRPIIS